jgi:ABC-type uncharacterized transport system involved in gliding motility auxiliary subunit
MAAVSLVFTVGVILLANVIAARLPARVDLTADHVFTLSPGSRQLVRSLPSYLTVNAYISSDLPPELASVNRYLRDLLDEYRTASQGMLRFAVYDPAADPKLEQQAAECRIGQLAVQAHQGQKLEVGRYYLGLCFWYGGKSRSLSPIGQADGLEYQISALIKLITQPRKKVAFTTGHGERDLGQGYSFVKQGLDRELQVVTIDPSANALGDDIDVLVVAGPRRPFDERARRELDAFLMKGKAALFLIDGMALEQPEETRAQAGGDGRQAGRPIDSGLEVLLERYGFRVGHDFVFDHANVPGPVRTGGRTLIANLPAFVSVRPDGKLDRISGRAAGQAPGRPLSVLDGIDMMVFPFASSVELVGPLADGRARSGQLWTLAATSAGAWRETGAFSLSPAAAFDESATAEKQSFALAYAYQGILRSAYSAIDLPDAPDKAGPPPPVAAPRMESRRPVHLVVVGDSDFVADDYMELLRSFPVYVGGPQMLFNAISWTLEDDALTPLRGNLLKARPIEIGSAARAAALKWGNIAGVPLVFCAAGLLRWLWRRAARRRQSLGTGGGSS